MDYEGLRFITVILALIGIYQLLCFYKKTRDPGVIAPISWLLNIMIYSMFKYIVRSDLHYYNISVIWVAITYWHGIIILIVTGYLFRDMKRGTHQS